MSTLLVVCVGGQSGWTRKGTTSLYVKKLVLGVNAGGVYAQQW